MPVVKEYFGQDLSRDELISREVRIHAEHRRGEALLLWNRWFDYRQMLPAAATYLFAAQYRHEYLEAYKRTQDIRTVNLINPFSPKDVFESSEVTAMWLARREADAIGCKYDFYLHMAFERFAARGWKNLPRPNQLYSEELTFDISDAWKKRCFDVMQLAEDDFYTLDRYAGHPDQDAYHAYIVEQIKCREHKHLALARVLSRFLPQELAGREFGEDLVRRAKSFMPAA